MPCGTPDGAPLGKTVLAKLYSLPSTRQKFSDPGNDGAWYTISHQFTDQNFMIDQVEGLTEIKEDGPYSCFISVRIAEP